MNDPGGQLPGDAPLLAEGTPAKIIDGSGVSGRYSRMPKRPRKLPRDPNARGFEIVRLATGESVLPEEPIKNPHAVALGMMGGAKGGRARAARLTKKQRSEAARKAARARWARSS
jgi:hypothetical protein